MPDHFDYDDGDYYRFIRNMNKKIKERKKAQSELEEFIEDLNDQKKFDSELKDITPEEFIKKTKKKK
jgi:hypothetical protein